MVQDVADLQQHAQQRRQNGDERHQQGREGAVQHKERQIHAGGIINIVYRLLIQGDIVRHAGEQPREGQKQQSEQVRGDAGIFNDVLRLALYGNAVKQHDAALLSARGSYAFPARCGNILTQCRRKHKCPPERGGNGRKRQNRAFPAAAAVKPATKTAKNRRNCRRGAGQEKSFVVISDIVCGGIVPPGSKMR